MSFPPFTCYVTCLSPNIATKHTKYTIKVLYSEMFIEQGYGTDGLAGRVSTDT